MTHSVSDNLKSRDASASKNTFSSVTKSNMATIFKEKLFEILELF